jgi:FkbM family methyltransferase
MSLLNTLKYVTNHPLNKNQKAQAVCRFLKWQIGSRLLPGKVVYTWINGAKIIISPGETALTGNLYCGLYEFTDMAFLLHVLRKEDLFVDVGANVGSYTILACASVGARGYCIEPVPSTYLRLMDNIRLNNLIGNVECLNIGLGDEKGIARFTSNRNCTNHVLKEGENTYDEITVRMDTLDSVLKNKSPFIIKVDVEGYENKILKGAQRVLSNESLQSLIIETDDRNSGYDSDHTSISELMNDFGFHKYTYDPFNRELTIPRHDKNNSNNTIYIRNKDIILDRIKHARYMTIHDIDI